MELQALSTDDSLHRNGKEYKLRRKHNRSQQEIGTKKNQFKCFILLMNYSVFINPPVADMYKYMNCVAVKISSFFFFVFFFFFFFFFGGGGGWGGGVVESVKGQQ